MSAHRRRLPLLFASALACGAAFAPAALASPGSAFNAASPTIFIAQGQPTQLDEAVESGGSLTFQPVGSPAAVTYNALAFDTVDDYIYGASLTGAGGIADDHIVKIDSSGGVTDTGVSLGFDANVGAWDPATDSVYYSAHGRSSMTIYDPATQATSTLTLSQSLVSYDLTYADGYLWGMPSNTGTVIERVDPTTGTVTEIPVPASLFPEATSFAGAAWTYGNGNVGFSSNSTGNVYQISIANPSAAAPSFTLVDKQPGPASNNNDGTASPGEPTDLSLVKTATASAEAGGTITYTLTVTNNGLGNSSGYVVTDTLPTPLVNPQTSTTGCAIASGTLTCQGAPLADGATAAPIIVTATAPTPFSGSITNTATVTANEDDPSPANNTSSATTTAIPTVDAGVTVTAPASATAGQPATFTITATNAGPSPATGTTVTVPIPAGATYAGGPSDCTATATTVTCSLGTLDAGATQTLALQFTPGAAGPITVAATIATDETDTNAANNAASATATAASAPTTTTTTTTTPPTTTTTTTTGTTHTKSGHKAPGPKLALTDGFTQRSVISGQTVGIVLTVRTTNGTTAHHARVCDVVPAGTTVVSAPHATVHGQRVCFTLSSVSGKARRLRITVRAAAVTQSTVRRDGSAASATSATTVHARGRVVVVPLPTARFTG